MPVYVRTLFSLTCGNNGRRLMIDSAEVGASVRTAHALLPGCGLFAPVKERKKAPAIARALGAARGQLYEPDP